ncbi:MAG: YggT family protein, partial [Anaerolineae bacterium]|nr:YggT family protein [Anaerolineae bacterium]
MSNEVRERIQVDDLGTYRRGQRVVEYNPSVVEVFVSRLTQLAWLVVSVIDLLIITRFVLKLLDANAANSFVNFIYDVSYPFVSLFNGIVESPTFDNGAILDVPSIIALVVWTLVAGVLIELFWILFAGTGRTRRVTTIE